MSKRSAEDDHEDSKRQKKNISNEHLNIILEKFHKHLQFVGITQSNNELKEVLESLSSSDVKLAIVLNELYPKNSFDRKGVANLQAQDNNTYQTLKHLNDSLPESDQFSFVIAHTCISTRGIKPLRYHDQEYDYDAFVDTYYDSGETFDSSCINTSTTNVKHTIKKWYDSNGLEMFKDKQTNMEFFNRVIDTSKQFNEVCPKIYDDREFWLKYGRHGIQHDNMYHKYLLVLWPKHCEKDIYIKMDLRMYIRSTYKELLCDPKANFDSAMKSVPIIIEECEEDNSLELEYEYVYNILESLKFIQDEELTARFLSTNPLKLAYLNIKQPLNHDLTQLLDEFNWDLLKSSFFSFMLPCDLQKIHFNVDLMTSLLENDKLEASFDCFTASILPIFNNPVQHSRIIMLIKCNNSLFDRIINLICAYQKQDCVEFQQILHGLGNLVCKQEKDTSRNAVEHDSKFIKALLPIDYKLAFCYLNKVILSIEKIRLEDLDHLYEHISTLVLFNEMASQADLLVDKTINVLNQHQFGKLVQLFLTKNKSKEIHSKPQIQKLYTHRIKFLKLRINSINDNFTWKMPDAIFNNDEIKAFLYSDQEQIKFRHNFNGIADARKFIQIHNSNNQRDIIENYYSVNMEAKGTGKSSYVLITKTKDYFNNRLKVKEKYENELKEIQNLIN